MPKLIRTFRLSRAMDRLLGLLALRVPECDSKTAVIEHAVRRLAAEHGIRLDGRDRYEESA